MEHDKGSDNTGGFGKDVDKLRDNTEGSISLKEFLEQVGLSEHSHLSYPFRRCGGTHYYIYTATWPRDI